MQLKANRLGEMLLESGLIDQFQLDSALSLQRNLGGRIGSAMVKLGYLPEETILEILESQAKYSRVALDDLEISPQLLTLIPRERLLHLLVIPIELRQSGKEKILRVAMTDPTNLQLVDELQFASGCRVLPVLASEDEIRQALRKKLSPEKLQPSPVAATDAFIDCNLAELGELSTNDPRLDRLLEVLSEKGILSAIEVERVKFG
jgi:type IV pilus assembly protein PilB